MVRPYCLRTEEVSNETRILTGYPLRKLFVNEDLSEIISSMLIIEIISHIYSFVKHSLIKTTRYIIISFGFMVRHLVNNTSK